jgi:hypothetical protein
VSDGEFTVSILGHSFDDFRVVVSSDPVKTDPELWCWLCDTHLCDIEAEDTMGVLLQVITDHATTR